MTLRGGGSPRRVVGRRPVPDEFLAGPRNGEPGGAQEPADDEPQRGPTRGAMVDDPPTDREPYREYEMPGRIRRGGEDLRKRYAREHSRGGGHVLRFAGFALILAALVVGGLYFVGRPLAVNALVSWGAENRTALSLPFVADVVRGELGPRLNEPAGTDPSAVSFMITPGETPRQIADGLLGAGLLKDATAAKAFVFQSIVSGADAAFRQGSHQLKQTMTPMQIIAALQAAAPTKPVVKLTFREGLRVEQMVAYLELKEAQPDNPEAPLKLDVKQFYALVKNPPETLTAKYAWLKPGRSLEGFLYPATYDVFTDVTPDELINKLLDAFAANAPADLLKLSPDQVYQRVILASIVETEAKVDSERPLIAGVYQNRLNGGTNFPTKLLEADPTVNYARDSMQLSDASKWPIEKWVTYTFWTRVPDPINKFQVPADLAGYQTYQNPGLPPGPICSPSTPSLQAAMAPDTASGYYFFVAKNDGSDTHAFDKTYAEFQADLKKYGYTP